MGKNKEEVKEVKEDLKQRDILITELYLSKEIDGIIKGFTIDYFEELKSELFIALCKMPYKKILQAKIDGYLIYHIVRVLRNQFNSETSYFYKDFKKERIEHINSNVNVDSEFITEGSKDLDRQLYFNALLEEENTIFENINSYLKTINEVDAILFRIRFKLGEYNIYDGEKRDKECKRSVSPYRRIIAFISIGELTIGHTTVFNSITKTIKGLKEYLSAKGITYNIDETDY